MTPRLAWTTGIVAALALAACDQAEDVPGPAPEPPTEEEIAAQTPNAPAVRPIELRADGLAMAATEDGGQEADLNFGNSQEDTISALTAVFGGPDMGTQEECPAGPMTVAEFGEFAVNFQDDRFVGWTLNGASERATFSGPGRITLGMARADAERIESYDRFDESTLGEEFMLGGSEMFISGMIENNQVSILWAGTGCTFR